MSANFENTTPLKVAEQAERDLNSDAAKKGHAGSASSTLPLFFTSLFHPVLLPAIPTTQTLPSPPHPKTPQSKRLTRSPTATDSGIDESATTKFPGSTVSYGTGGSLNREIPESEGGSVNPATGNLYKAGDFAKGGVGAPEAAREGYARNHGGEDDVRGNTVDGATLRESGAK
ncbi:hypothetical protein FB567DRAFT_610234 [Paraphoma chrysanthemicola]|uniref:Uncharacterized protein n=1 Tax=Paraphoma chrysanthemicola TaxID=798071 RepID=A0A8K0W3C1_9PLEO|nr:hypothetical protein FB567DRAFT_610234 [Paraphoma chrysanthemicola]